VSGHDREAPLQRAKPTLILKRCRVRPTFSASPRGEAPGSAKQAALAIIQATPKRLQRPARGAQKSEKATNDERASNHG
jgi:hypothetical protein